MVVICVLSAHSQDVAENDSMREILKMAHFGDTLKADDGAPKAAPKTGLQHATPKTKAAPKTGMSPKATAVVLLDDAAGSSSK
jgi:hypothetical protein